MRNWCNCWRIFTHRFLAHQVMRGGTIMNTSATGRGIRQLFSLPENIQMARYGLDFFAGFHETMAIDGEPAPIGFRRRGYLFVSDDGDHARMEANHRTQESLGARVDLLDRAARRRRGRRINVG